MTSRSKSQGAAMFRSQLGDVAAPLAPAENIEIAIGDYCHVKDAVPLLSMGDNDYQIVEDALPPGQLHRIRSTKSPIRVKGVGRTDSDDSSVSSLERELTKTRKGGGHHRRKSKPRSKEDSEPLYATPTPGLLSSVVKPRSKSVHGSGRYGGRENLGRSQSPSEGSEGTGDEVLLVVPTTSKKTKKSRSFNHRKWRTPSSGKSNRASSHTMTDREHLIGNPQMVTIDDMSFYNPVVHHFQTLPKTVGGASTGLAEEAEFDPNDSGNWSKFLKTMRDPEKQRKKDERRKQKEEEKRAKEAQKRAKKKESKYGMSAASHNLEDFPTSSENLYIPHFVYKCVTYIESEGLSTEGLYRIPGNKLQVELFSSQYSLDANIDISSLEIPVNAVATLLKTFFSDLTDALVPSSLCDELLEAAAMKKNPEMTEKSSRLIMLRGVIRKLPAQNREVLKFIILHLYKVSCQADVNSMNSVNLAKCWWPTLIRLQFQSYERLKQYSQVPEDIVQTLIEQCGFFFLDGNEV